MWLTTYMKSWQNFEYVMLVAVPMFLFSGTFYPLSVYPHVIGVIVAWSPLYQGVVILRDLVLGAPSADLRVAGGVPDRARRARAGARRAQDRQIAAGLTWDAGLASRYATGVPGEYRPRAVGAAGGTDVDTAVMRRDGLAAPAPGSAWRDPVTWALAALVFCAYFVISLFRLLRLSPASYDLGIYTEYVKQLSQLHAPVVDVLAPGFNLLGNHFQVAIAVLAPFFRVFPSPATLLFCQALATAISVFPVVSAGFALSGKATGRLIGFAYGFSWGLQQMIDFDFHEIALAVPLLAFSLSALVRRRPAAAICWAAPLVFVEEDRGSPWR